MLLVGSKVKLSTAYHPQTDGQTKRTNRTFQDMLRCYATATTRRIGYVLCQCWADVGATLCLGRACTCKPLEKKTSTAPEWASWSRQVCTYAVHGSVHCYTWFRSLFRQRTGCGSVIIVRADRH